MEFIRKYLTQVQQIIDQIDPAEVQKMVDVLRRVREQNGRLFLIGSGGGAGHASHATCDFRKLGGFDAICPLDNVSELTARVNDEGWDTSISKNLQTSRLNAKDCLFIFSVGGGSEEKNISTNLVNAIKAAKQVRAQVVGIVGKDGGYTAKCADACIVVPPLDPELITPHTEGLQAVFWHLLISHPDLKLNPTKWESTK
ncbi:MAG: SIS domain-containing protein [Verrucomicrobia bacterium]|nr:SIS domain-containing protein [Verrucomicrobiota bacterium]